MSKKDLACKHMVRDFSPLAILDTTVKVFCFKEVRAWFQENPPLRCLCWLTWMPLYPLTPQVPSWGGLSSNPLQVPVGSKKMAWMLSPRVFQSLIALSGSIWDSPSPAAMAGEKGDKHDLLCLVSIQLFLVCLFLFFSLSHHKLRAAASLDGFPVTPLSVELRLQAPLFFKGPIYWWKKPRASSQSGRSESSSWAQVLCVPPPWKEQADTIHTWVCNRHRVSSWSAVECVCVSLLIAASEGDHPSHRIHSEWREAICQQRSTLFVSCYSSHFVMEVTDVF